MTEHAPVRMRRVRQIHCVGIGGAGMGGIAEVLHNLGYVVTGSDLSSNAMTRRLTELGVLIRDRHDAANVEGADVVVVSSAVTDENPEVQAARARRIPVVRRAEMLAELMRFREGVAVAGTHGKTTTTSLVTSLLAEGGLDPTFVIGGRLNSLGTHAGLGTGPFLVAEADESDASFLLLSPVIAVVTNIDADHMETYGGEFSRLRQAFREFVARLPFHGVAVVCIDDPAVRELLPDLPRPVITYGFSEDADLRARHLVADGWRSRFEVCFRDGTVVPVESSLAGRHNVLNALAAIAVARELGVATADWQRGLAQFAGIARRFQGWGEVRVGEARVLLIDDYGHHPAELRAVMQAARESFPERRLFVVFQPHRYTRTRDLFEDFVDVLSGADALLLLEVYAAGEAPLRGADGPTLARAIRLRGRLEPVFARAVADVPGLLRGLVEEGDLLLTLGAGDIGQLAPRLAREGGSVAA